MPHKKWKPNLKKRVWDLEKYINFDKIDPKVKEAKLQELKDLKGILKKQRHAKTLSTKYKGIWFVEKTKVEWKIKQKEKLLKELEKNLDSKDEEKTELWE